VKRGLTGSHRARYLFKLIFWLTLIFGILLFPWMEEVESDCTLVPKQRVKVVTEIAGRIERVIVREGALVKKGDELAKQDTAPLEADMAHTREELLAASAEVQAYRSKNDPASEEIAATKVRSAAERIKKLEHDIRSATLRAPFDGVVMTKDIELQRGVYLNAGSDFCVVGTTDAWNLNVHIHEKQIGKVEKLMEEKRAVDVHFILYSQNQQPLVGQLKDRSQISQIAYPHERENAVRENAFIITLPDVQAPPEIRQGFRSELTGRSSIQVGRRPVILIWSRNIAQWFRLKWVW
jgi:multidrug resistance efflux pump